MRLRRARQRQLDALVRAYRRYGSDVRVRVTYTPADERGIRHEEVTLQRVAEENLDVLRELNCDRQAQRRLRRLLGD